MMLIPELIANSPSIGTDASLTTLSGNGGSITSGATTMHVAGAAPSALQGSGQQFRVLIDQEILIIDASTSSGTTWTILQRGAEGSSPASHNDGTAIWHKPTAGMLDGRYAKIQTTQLPKSNGTDDTSTINTSLTSGGIITGRYGQTYLISAPLVIPSNTILDMTGCTIGFTNTSVLCNMLQNYSVANPVATATNVATTAGSNVVVSSTLAAVAVQGQVLAVVGAGPQGGGVGANNIWLYGTVLSIAGNNITLTSNNINGIAANITASGQTGYLFNRDSNITVIGGTWNGGTNWNSGTASSGVRPTAGFNSHQLRFRRVDGLTILRTKLQLNSFPQGGGYVFGINPADCTDVLIDDVTGIGSSTTVQADGPIQRMIVRNVRGQTQDDMLALGSVSIQGNDTEGDITDVLIDGITSNGSWSAFKAFSGQGSNGVTRFIRGTVRSIKGTTFNLSPIKLVDYSGAGNGITQLLLEDISVKGPAGSSAVTNSALYAAPKYLPTTIAQPDSGGLLAWTCDPADVSTTFQPSSGFIYVFKFEVPAGITISSSWIYLDTLGATLTTNDNLIGIYDPQGNMGTPGGLIAKTADQTAVWASPGTIGFKSAAFTAQGGYSLDLVGAPGIFYWAAILSVGTTMPKFRSKGPATLAAGGIRYHVGFNSGANYQTTVPGAIHRIGFELTGGRTSLISLNGTTISDNGFTQTAWVGII